MQTLALRGHAVAVSGRGARDLAVNRELHPHLLARDGWASRENLHAAVVAPTTAQADMLATALAVLPARDGLALINSVSGAGAQIVDAEGQIHRSADWSQFLAADQSCQASAAGAAWPDQFAVSISFEVPRVADTTKPFIAIWITDAQRNVVRTLLVVGDHARWRESNYVFWRRVERFDLAGVQAMARPSRAPGRYTVVWDGLDARGGLVPQGQYTLNIEASREHGSHTMQAIALDLSGAPLQTEIAAQAELGATQVRYGRPS
jgi:thiamine biosynthesis lipoprotein